MTRSIIALFFAVGCTDTVQVIEPPPTPPIEEQAFLDIATSFLMADGVAGCEVDPTGEIWVEMSSISGLMDPVLLVQSCSAQMTFAVPPMPDAVVQVRTDGRVPASGAAADPMPPVEQPELRFATDWINVGDVEVGDRKQVMANLVCEPLTPGACGEPIGNTTITVSPSFEMSGAVGGCELNSSGLLWMELDSGLDDRIPQILVQACNESVTYAVDFASWYSVQVRSEEWQLPTASPPADAFQPDPIMTYYASEWMEITLEEGADLALEVTLGCYELDVADACGGA